MLQKEKSMFLKTKVYSDEDPIVKQLNEKLDALLKQRPENEIIITDYLSNV